MTDTASPQGIESTTPAGGEPGTFARIAGVFFSPAKTFESIRRKPGWVVPMVVLLLWTLVSGFLVTSRIDVDAVLKKQVDKAEAQGRTIPPEQLDKMRPMTAMFIKISFLFIACWVVGALFLVPAIYHGLTSVAGKAGSYLAVVSAYTHVQFVQVIKGALLLAVALPKTSVDPDSFPTLLKSNLAAYFDPESLTPALRALLTNVDVFDLWGVALCIIALPRVTRLSTQGAAAIVLGCWALWILVSVGLAGLGAAFGG